MEDLNSSRVGVLSWFTGNRYSRTLTMSQVSIELVLVILVIASLCFLAGYVTRDWVSRRRRRRQRYL